MLIIIFPNSRALLAPKAAEKSTVFGYQAKICQKRDYGV
jgi:hypothetical protein